MWFKSKKISPERIERKDNRYIFGKYLFAEWRHEDAISSPHEGWTFYKNVDHKRYNFCTDTEQNAQDLLAIFDKVEEAKISEQKQKS